MFDWIYTEQDIRRFYKYVVIGKPDECWEWLGPTALERGTFTLHRNRKQRQMSAARFIFWFTTGHWPGDLEVCHYCNNPMCVNPAHLYLATHQKNMADAARDGLLIHRFTKVQILEIRAKYEDGMSQAQLGREYGANHATICAIVNRKIWKHLEGDPPRPPQHALHGEANPNSKLTEVEVREIRTRYANGEKQTQLAEAYGIRQAKVSMIVRRECWSHVK